MRKHAGFTLIEALLVLTIVSFFVSLPTVAMKEASRTLTTIYFFDSLEKSILTCQQTAIIANKGADVMQDYNNRRTLAFQLETGEWLAHLTVPDTLTIGNMKGKIAFSGGTGNAKGDQKIIFTWPEKIKKLSITSYSEKVTTKRLLRLSHKGFILLESLVAIGMLMICIVLYQANQLHLVKESHKQYQEVRMLRVLAEEVRERQLGGLPGKQYSVTRNGQFSVTYDELPFHKTKIESEQLIWEIYRED